MRAAKQGLQKWPTNQKQEHITTLLSFLPSLCLLETRKQKDGT